MMTATTNDTLRSPRFIRAAATLAAAIAISVGFLSMASPARQDAQTNLSLAGTPTATLGAGDLTANPLQVTSDLTPVVSAQITAATSAAHPFQLMVDLTPVVSAHINAAASSTDPFEGMRDLTPVVAAYTNDIN